MIAGAKRWNWTAAAAVLGFTVSFGLSGVLRWPRPAFVAAWGVVVLLFFGLYLTLERVDFRIQLRRHWKAGVWIGLVIGSLLAFQVYGQPASNRSTGLRLIAELAGYGVGYGLVDALILSVIPALTLYGAQSTEVLRSPSARLGWALAALAACGLITAAYHAGFGEFRGPALFRPIIGNLLVTLAYLLSGSPIAACLAHILMHMAAVLRGIESTLQLPPHF